MFGGSEASLCVKSWKREVQGLFTRRAATTASTFEGGTTTSTRNSSNVSSWPAGTIREYEGST